MTRNGLHINGEIIERCKKGEVKAQFLLYKQYSGAMYNIAVRLLNNKMDAEDVLQESFITAFEKLTALTNQNSFGSWFRRIVINNCISFIRKKMVFDDIHDEIREEQTDEEEFYSAVDPALIHESIKRLPAGSRTILVLRALEGYRHKEIAQMLGISESTSKSQYSRALTLLNRQLKQKIYVSRT